MASSIPVVYSNNIKIYNVTGLPHQHLPQWLIQRRTKKLRQDLEYNRRIQLIQDLEFPEAALRLSFTPDQQHLIATGVYKPQFRVFDLAETSIKFERHTTSETVSQLCLSEDWRKLVLLQANRWIEFHGPSGLYYSNRIPRAGRDMAFDTRTCDLLLAGSAPELYRLNLDRGQFMAPLVMSTEGVSAINCVRIAPLHGLYGLAGDAGVVEFWDARDRHRMGAISIARNSPSGSKDIWNTVNEVVSTGITDNNSSLEVTTIKFLPDGLHWVAGTSDGRVLLFDLRTLHRPLLIRQHHNGLPIHKIEFDEQANHINGSSLLSADKRSIRIWKSPSSSTMSMELNLFCTVESDVDINDFVLQSGTGLVLAATEASPVASYFIPELGPAPRWCSYLDRLTEELEEGGEHHTNEQGIVYDNFKFITRTELNSLGLDHFVGTRLLRPHLHGYFINLKLYEKARAIANPFAYEEWRARRKQEQLERERQSRIRTNSNDPNDISRKAKVNRQLATKLALESQSATTMTNVADNDKVAMKTSAKKVQRIKQTATALLQDERFSELFKDPDFEIDMASMEYRQIHPKSSHPITHNDRK